MRNCSDSVIIIYLRSRCLRENTKYSLIRLKTMEHLVIIRASLLFLDFICHVFFHWLSGTEIGREMFSHSPPEPGNESCDF